MKNFNTDDSNWITTSTDYFDLLDRPHKHHQHEHKTDIVLSRGSAPLDSVIIPKVLIVSEREEHRDELRQKFQKEHVPFIETRSMKEALTHILHEPIKMLVVNCDKDIHNVCDLFDKADAALPPNENLVIPFQACTSCKKCEMKCANSKHFKLVG